MFPFGPVSVSHFHSKWAISLSTLIVSSSTFRGAVKVHIVDRSEILDSIIYKNILEFTVLK